MANTDVFPPYNLPDEAIPWGREAQKRIVAGEKSEVQLSQKVDNGLRATAGQLSTLASQVTELSEGRRSHTVTPSSVSVTYNASAGAHLMATVPFSLPSPEGGVRSAILMFSFGADKVTGNASGFDMWTEVLWNGSAIWRSANRTWVGPSGSVPPGWSEGVSDGSTYLVIPEGASSEDFAFRFWSYDFSADAGRTVMIRGLRATVLYLDRT